jgi:NADH-quinone oxidoreductase subunit E
MTLIPQPDHPESGAILARLHEIQETRGYLSQASLRHAARELNVSLSQLYSAATFYSAFSFQPRGRHTVRVCMGTACHIRGGEKLLERLKAMLNVLPGETTEDGAFTLETVHCVGSCSMSPVIQLNGETRGRLRSDRLLQILKPYGLKDKAKPEGKGI